MYVLNWKSSYDVSLFYVAMARLSTTFRGILICVFFRHLDMQECIHLYVQYLFAGVNLGFTVANIRLFSSATRLQVTEFAIVKQTIYVRKD